MTKVIRVKGRGRAATAEARNRGRRSSTPAVVNQRSSRNFDGDMEVAGTDGLAGWASVDQLERAHRLTISSPCQKDWITRSLSGPRGTGVFVDRVRRRDENPDRCVSQSSMMFALKLFTDGESLTQVETEAAGKGPGPPRQRPIEAAPHTLKRETTLGHRPMKFRNCWEYAESDVGATRSHSSAKALR